MCIMGKCNLLKAVAVSVSLGLLITIASSLVMNTCVIGEFPNVRFVSIPMLGLSYWGMPLPWMKQVVYPGAVKEVIPIHMLVDVLFWAAAVFVAKLLYFSVAKKPGRKPHRVKKRKAR